MKVLKTCAAFIIWGALCVLASRSRMALADSPQPRFQAVALTPVVIEPLPFEGATPRADEADMLHKLSEAATSRVEQNLLHRHIAGAVERVAGDKSATSPIVVSCMVWMPVSLPRNVIGWNGLSRNGSFATVKMTVTGAAGTVLAQSEITLDWNDVRWLRGTHQTRRNRPLEDVLMDFARRGADDVVKKLAKGRT